MADQARNSSTAGQPGWNWALILAWLAGALAPQPYFQFEKKLGNGNFGYNIALSTILVVLGVIAVVGLLRLARRVVRGTRRESFLHRASLALLGTAAACSLAPFLPRLPFALYWVALAALAAWLVLVLAVLAATLRDPVARAARGSARPERARARRPWTFNGAFWLLFLALLLAIDLWKFAQIGERNGLETILLLAGRLLTLGAFTLGILLFIHAMLVLFPAPLHWLAIGTAAVLPALVAADFAAGLYWQQSLLDVLNSFTLAGRFDVTQLLEAAGIKNTPFQVLLALLAVTALSLGLFLGLQKLSYRFPARIRIHIRTGPALIIFGALWLGAIAQQALSMVVLRKEVWQAEHSAFKIHLGLFRPDPGHETIEVEFAEQFSEAEAEALLAGDLPTLARKPDIYIVMVETWRADSITPEIAPFLHKFRADECQQFATTFAGSNCTPVSWFTMFHSRLGIHWKQAVARESDPGGLRGAYPVRLLHKLGYRNSVRAVCDLSYQEMADLNFGAGHKLAETYLDNPMLPRGLEIPEREVIVVDDLKEQLAATSVGGSLHFLALDSPHYNYYWPDEQFQPIHTDCAGNINYASLNPSPEEIREVVKRYENSIHWIDRQIEEFVAFLKAKGRYDDAIIILTGDHGEEFQEHGSWFHCSNLKRPQTEVPIMIKWPHWVTAQPDQPLVTHLDVMPSVLDALGLDEKYFHHLAGQSVLRPHSGEAVISTLWAGVSGIGVCFVKDGLKANFAASALWTGNVPETLYFMGYSDFDDNPLDPITLRGDLSHSAFLRKTFPAVTERFFTRFQAKSDAGK